jgi:ferric-dicitrate binding protein FerR (iron transport regulator)
MKETVTGRILNAYFENRATPHERLLIKQWLKEEGNEEIFYQRLAAWEASHLQFVPDEQRARAKFKQTLSKPLQHTPALRTPWPQGQLPNRRRMTYLSVAASLAIFLCLSFYLSRDYFLYDTYSTDYGMTKNVLLPDGSEVTLNANSTLKVSKNMVEQEVREVWLDGEAFFSITKRPNNVRFAVHTDNLDVEVLGTKFNVNNRRGKTEVILSEGSVRLTSELKASDKSTLYMKPGDYVSLSRADSTFLRRVVVPEKFTAWQSNKLVFDETPLRIVAQKIEDYYGVKVEIADTVIAGRLVTGTLPNNDLGIVLRSLNTSHNLNIKREDNRILIN